MKFQSKRGPKRREKKKNMFCKLKSLCTSENVLLVIFSLLLFLSTSNLISGA
jgi:hypothetical protein